MPSSRPKRHTDIERCVDAVLADVGKDIVLGLPLGIGKASHFANALFRRAAADSSIRLTIFTALTPQRPTPSNDLERRFLEPIVERMFRDYPELAYASAQRNGCLPKNVDIHEFYFQPGTQLDNEQAQQGYVSSNYTHVARDLLDRGVNVIAQLVAVRGKDVDLRYSVSCNADIIVDLLPALRRREKTGHRFAIVGQVNRNLPFMPGPAEFGPEAFDHIVDSEKYAFDLFAPPKRGVAPAEYAIGLHAARLIKDGGTLQIGIGSLGDAVTYALMLRHERNALFREAVSALCAREEQWENLDEREPFEKGLYGLSEMFVDGLMKLYKARILRKRVYPDETIQRLLNRGELTEAVTPETLRALYEAGAVHGRLTEKDFAFLQRHGILKAELTFADGRIRTAAGETIPADLEEEDAWRRIGAQCLGDGLKGGVVLHAAFFLDTQEFYDSLHALSEEERLEFAMTGISFVNELYGDGELKREQRRNARFFNNAMMVTLSGAVVSDGLEDGRVVSGVGGQYNFIAMAHALPGARAIVALRATREKAGRVHSNIVWNYGHATIPRHLRDIVVTEYGVADLRGRSDRDVIAALLAIADSRFQPELLERAKETGKIESEYEIPRGQADNFPERLEKSIAPFRERGLFPDYPFGTDLTAVEQRAAKVLTVLTSLTGQKGRMTKHFISALRMKARSDDERALLSRLGLDKSAGLKQWMWRKMILKLARDDDS